MKTHTSKLFITLLLASLVTLARGATVTTYDSVISLATNLTKNYSFTDPVSGQSVTVALTMTPYSASTANPAFTLLDTDSHGNYTHLGVDSGQGGGDGNLIVYGEGANFSATLISSSSGVTASSVRFAIAGLDFRTVDGQPNLSWTSSATATKPFALSGETLDTLDTTNATIYGLNYSGQLRYNLDLGDDYQISDASPLNGQSLVLTATFTATGTRADPHTNSWFTTFSGKYARIYTSDVNKTNGASLTTWSTGSTTQVLPVYCGVQEIYSSSNWVYIRSSGLGSHIMGPWYLNAAHTQAFPNYPTNQHALYRISRQPVAAAVKTANSGGPIGYFVDGVAMFNSWDAYYWNGSADVQSSGSDGYWNRDAYINEGVSFDPNNAHQAGGQHHYHANPPALRYLLDDHVNFNSTTKAYPEATNVPAKHSPILAWVGDGYPLYGPYGYSNPTNANSGISRMISGYILRNGQDGSENLTTMGRTYLPQWAVRLYGVSSNVISGPAVSTSYPLNRYMEDNDYLGDLVNSSTGTNFQQGVDFNLDQYNGRWCVTPEFPQGTYAYFVSIASDGTPVFPYNIGRGYYGSPTASSVTSISEAVATNFLGGPEAVPSLNAPTVKGGGVTLTWSATEGGNYLVQSTTNFANWVTNSTTVPAVLSSASYTNTPTDSYRFYRVARTALGSYDSVGTGGGSGSGSGLSTVAPGGTAMRGTTVTVTITLPVSPPDPPGNAPISSVTLAGSIAGTNITDVTSGTVVATFTIPSNASTGTQNIVIAFNSGPSYTVSLTIN